MPIYKKTYYKQVNLLSWMISYIHGSKKLIDLSKIHGE